MKISNALFRSKFYKFVFCIPPEYGCIYHLFYSQHIVQPCSLPSLECLLLKSQRRKPEMKIIYHSLQQHCLLTHKRCNIPLKDIYTHCAQLDIFRSLYHHLEFHFLIMNGIMP